MVIDWRQQEGPVSDVSDPTSGWIVDGYVYIIVLLLLPTHITRVHIKHLNRGFCVFFSLLYTVMRAVEGSAVSRVQPTKTRTRIYGPRVRQRPRRRQSRLYKNANTVSDASQCLPWSPCDTTSNASTYLI